MTYDIQPRPVKTGTDPRALTDFIALREEMAKLMHPARPDVNWKQVETLSLSLFDINGVELQTGAWYTLARSHLARIEGFNEGLAILTALLGYQWAQFWPSQNHARAEILNGLFQRLQTLFRTFSLKVSDLASLKQSERLLKEVHEILERQALKHVCQTATLQRQIESAIIRLENSPSPVSPAPAVVLPPQALASEQTPDSRLVYVIRPEPEMNVQSLHATPSLLKRRSAFLSGACSALAVVAIALAGWHFVPREDEATSALAASLAPLPKVLTSAQIQVLNQPESTKPDAQVWLSQAASQLDVLATLTPDWSYQYGRALQEQAEALWPGKPEVVQLQKQWQQQQAENMLPASALNGWHDGMQQLQALTDRLNTLDGQKGKYITVSELKSTVYEMMNHFRQTVPLEEQLRVLQSQQGDASLATQRQIERHLNGVIQAYGERGRAE